MSWIKDNPGILPLAASVEVRFSLSPTSAESAVWSVFGVSGCSAIHLVKEVQVLNKGDWTIVIHGGVLDGHPIPDENLAQQKAGLERALSAGRQLLEQGKDAVDAVEAAIRILEDDSCFNAGRGSVMTLGGTYELDASIMSGATRNAGAVAGMQTVSNPISVARAVMEDGRHLLLCSEGAEAFAKQKGFHTVAQDYFFNESMFQEIQQQREFLGLPALEHPSQRPSFGTVGAVAIDRNRNMAAGTSTGGMTGKLPGRIGDSCIIGAGNYAENQVVATSATGMGEKFILNSAAAQVAWWVKHMGLTPKQAVHRILHEVLPLGAGGMIAVGADGEPIMDFTTTAMNRGFAMSNGELKTFVLRE